MTFLHGLRLESQEKYTQEQKERKKQAKAALGDDSAELEEEALAEDAEEEVDDAAAKMPHMLIGSKPDLPIEKSCRGDKAGSIQVSSVLIVFSYCSSVLSDLVSSVQTVTGTKAQG